MKYLLLIICLIQFQSCSLKNDNITIYKDLGNVNRASDITIESFWAFRQYDIDSTMIVNDKEKVEIICILEKIKSRKKDYIPFMNPKFAIVSNVKGEIDTLYLDSEYRFGFWIKRKILIEDKKGDLKSFLKVHNNSFFD